MKEFCAIYYLHSPCKMFKNLPKWSFLVVYSPCKVVKNRPKWPFCNYQKELEPILGRLNKINCEEPLPYPQASLSFEDSSHSPQSIYCSLPQEAHSLFLVIFWEVCAGDEEAITEQRAFYRSGRYRNRSLAFTFRTSSRIAFESWSR